MTIIAARRSLVRPVEGIRRVRLRPRHTASRGDDLWRNWQGGAFETAYFAWLDYLEFAVWLGVPLTMFTLAAGRRAVLQAVEGNFRQLVLPALILLFSFLYLGFFGHTKAESGRLWLLLVPIC